MSEPTFESFLRNKLPSSLPGPEAQFRMAPRPKGGPWLYPRQPEQPLRRSAVLVPLIPAAGSYELLLTLRQPHIRHGGQWSFPGGIMKRDESPEQAALRETEEEVGIPPHSVDCLGAMTPLYMDPTGTLVMPFVGVVRTLPELRLQASEVSDVMRVPIDELLDPGRRRTDERWLRESLYEVPFWDLHPTPLWGATAMMLSELIALYERFTGDSGREGSDGHDLR